jgi:hypothetical protein
MNEARAMRHRIPLRDAEWRWVPSASRAALLEVARQNNYEIPRSLAVAEATGHVTTKAVHDLTPLALEIVPTHDQAEAMYRWFETLTKLETGGELKGPELPEPVLKTLRGVPWAYDAIQKELEKQERAYLDRHGDRGGWTQLKMIIDWTFFGHMWQLLDKERPTPDEVAKILSALVSGRPLSTLSEIRALSRTT